VKTRTLIAGVLVFAIGVLMVAVGIYYTAYDRANRSARESYGAGKSFDAVSTLKVIVGLPASDPRLRYNLGIALNDMSMHDDAMAEFQKFVDLTDNPKLQAQGYYLLAWSLVLDVNDNKKPSDIAASEYVQALRYLAEAMWLDQSNKGAKNLYERIMHLFRDNPPPPEEKGERPIPGMQPSTQPEEPKP